MSMTAFIIISVIASLFSGFCLLFSGICVLKKIPGEAAGWFFAGGLLILFVYAIFVSDMLSKLQ